MAESESGGGDGAKRCTVVLSQLTPREAKALRLRFGVDLTTDHMLEDVGR